MEDGDARPWHRVTVRDVGGVEIQEVGLDYAALAVALGATDDRQSLANAIAAELTGYIHNGAAARHWLRGEARYSVEDLWSGLSHACRDGASVVGWTQRPSWSVAHGHHTRSYDATAAFLALLASAMRTAALDDLDADASIRWWLYNQDTLTYMSKIEPAAADLAQIYSARTFDFFLPRIDSPEWHDSWNTAALFHQVKAVARCLDVVGRHEEAHALSEDIQARARAFSECQAWASVALLHERGRVPAERWWVGCLGPDVWRCMARESRENLVDSRIFGRMVEQGLYRSWRHPTHSLCLAIERELNHSIFGLLVRAHESDPDIAFDGTSAREKARRRTFEAVVRAIHHGRSLTLGELRFVLRFWDDQVMDSCTRLFSAARELLSQLVDEPALPVLRVKAALTESIGIGNPPWDVIELRNACAHPGHEEELQSREGHDALLERLVESPRTLLRAVTMELRGVE